MPGRDRNAVLFAIRGNVVTDNILTSIMLMKTFPGTIVANVVFDNDMRGSLIGVNSPPAIETTADIENQIVVNPSSRLNAECVNAAHVTQHLLADVMQKIEADPVLARFGFTISPYPAAGDRGIVKIMDMIVFHQTVAGMPEQNPHCTQEIGSAVVNMIVRHGNMMNRLFRFVLNRRTAGYDNPPSPEIGKVVIGKFYRGRTGSNTDTVPVGMFDFAVFKCTVFRSGHENDARNICGGLSAPAEDLLSGIGSGVIVAARGNPRRSGSVIIETAFRDTRSGIAEGQPVEADALDKLFFLCIL